MDNTDESTMPLYDWCNLSCRIKSRVPHESSSLVLLVNLMNSKCILNEVETRHHLISKRLYFTLTILITEDESQPYFFKYCYVISEGRRSKRYTIIIVFFTNYNKMKIKEI